MGSIKERRITCNICGTVKTLISATSEFDIGEWEAFTSPNPEQQRKMYLCNGCVAIFKQLWSRWAEEQKPKVAGLMKEEKPDETETPKKRGRPPKKKEGE